MSSTDQTIAAVGRLTIVPTILELVAKTTGMNFTAVAHVTRERWIACAVHDRINFGLAPGGELPVKTTICDEVLQLREPIVFGDASCHPVYSRHQTPKMYAFRSYISIPIIRRDDSIFGTLCAIDPQPTNLDKPDLIATLTLFAKLIALSLDADDEFARSASQLTSANDTASLREQFIAVLGHDLRSPLQAISMAAEVIDVNRHQPPKAALITMIRRSCLRMASLIDDILDFSRGKLGSGIPAVLGPTDTLAATFRHIAEETRSSTPDRDLRVAINLPDRVVCDAPRLAQLVTNLLANAMTHGAPDQPVFFTARTIDGRKTLEVTVTNGGPPIPEATRASLFEPFVRASEHASSNGLGLGLYIASEIAKSHGGTLGVSSTLETGTVFTFRMPLLAMA